MTVKFEDLARGEQVFYSITGWTQKINLTLSGKCCKIMMYEYDGRSMPEMGFPSQNQSGGNTTMKNRLICLALCLVFVLSAFLTGCGEKSTGEITEEIIKTSSENARTLTMWLVAEKAVDAATAEAVTKAINDIKAGKIEYRLDKSNIIHCPIGKSSFTEDQLLTNYTALIDAIVKARPAAVKGQYIKSISLATTMGPGVKVVCNRY
jgi:hypothetical protein